MKQFIFVGEKRSKTAIERGWTWQDGRLASATLHAALASLGLSRRDVLCVNILTDTGALHRPTLALLQQRSAHDAWQVVGMGHIVCALLRRHHIPHIFMIHPAARGAIRKRHNYQAHVRTTLAPWIPKEAGLECEGSSRTESTATP